MLCGGKTLKFELASRLATFLPLDNVTLESVLTGMLSKNHCLFFADTSIFLVAGG